MRFPSLLLACGLPLLAAGCLHDHGLPPFGEAVTRNAEAHKVSELVDHRPPEGSGAQGALGVERYKAGQVRQLAPSSSSTTNLTRDDSH
jgi:hypothetical protein